jgi:hypothetical protein
MRQFPLQARQILTTLPANNGKLLRSPRKNLLRLSQLLELHRKLTLLDFVLGEDFQVASETKKRAQTDEPFGGIVLIPLDGITIIHGELVVEIMVAFTNGRQGGNEVITRSVLIVERSLAKPVSEGVHAKGRL